MYPSSYSIFLDTVYEDKHCSPTSSVDRTELNSPVLCQGVGFNFPKLIDSINGSETGLPNPPTDVAYILNGNTSGLWIEFNFLRPLLPIHVTLYYYYYCTGTPPQLQLIDGSIAVPPSITPPCEKNSHRHFLSFELNSTTNTIGLLMTLSGGVLYLTEVEFHQVLGMRPS